MLNTECEWLNDEGRKQVKRFNTKVGRLKGGLARKIKTALTQRNACIASVRTSVKEWDKIKDLVAKSLAEERLNEEELVLSDELREALVACIKTHKVFLRTKEHLKLEVEQELAKIRDEAFIWARVVSNRVRQEAEVLPIGDKIREFIKTELDTDEFVRKTLEKVNEWLDSQITRGEESRCKKLKFWQGIVQTRLAERKRRIEQGGPLASLYPDDDLSDDGYSSVEELKQYDPWVHKYKIKRTRWVN